MGTPAPSHLHAEDTAFLLVVLARLGIRSSVDRMSFTAPRSVGGLQLASVVECVVCAVASERLFLLNGCTLASQLARDSLREVVMADPMTSDVVYSFVPKAMAFLASYGIYVTVATDKLVGRTL